MHAKHSKLEFHHSFNNFAETLPRSMLGYLEVSRMCTVRGDVVLNLSSHIVPCYRKRKTNLPRSNI